MQDKNKMQIRQWEGGGADKCLGIAKSGDSLFAIKFMILLTILSFHIMFSWFQIPLHIHQSRGKASQGLKLKI